MAKSSYYVRQIFAIFRQDCCLSHQQRKPLQHRFLHCPGIDEHLLPSSKVVASGYIFFFLSSGKTIKSVQQFMLLGTDLPVAVWMVIRGQGEKLSPIHHSRLDNCAPASSFSLSPWARTEANMARVDPVDATPFLHSTVGFRGYATNLLFRYCRIR